MRPQDPVNLERALRFSDRLVHHSTNEVDIEIVWVPYAFEIQLAAQKLANSRKYDTVICLGAVIRGSTTHIDFVANEVSKGIAHVSLNSGVPVICGILTTDSIERAIERSGNKSGNKSFDAAMTAIEMTTLLRQF